MEYEDDDDHAYAKAENTKVKVGARAGGVKREDQGYSVMEVEADAGIDADYSGVSVGAGAKAHAFKIEAKDNNVSFRAFGGDVRASAGLDLESFVKEGRVLGGEVKARATLSECTVGPLYLYLGAGVSTGAQVENGTLDARLAGNGIKVGKRIGVSVFDTEYSMETLSLVGKGWLWGKW